MVQGMCWGLSTLQYYSSLDQLRTTYSEAQSDSVENDNIASTFEAFILPPEYFLTLSKIEKRGKSAAVILCGSF